ncbi:unnamed protein product [Urochloa decumbens]|uniref:Uncharacterized protein n=1 Tax=Urochloa decumbens TaxID=240449 RepID=A0ABC9DXL3_9POAL
MILGASSAHVLQHLPIPPLLGPGHRRRLLTTAHAAARRDDATPGGLAEPEASSPSSESSKMKTKADTKPAAPALAPAAGFPNLKQDYSHTLFRSECLEVLGLVDVESLRRRPRLTVGVTVKASVVLPVLVVLAVLYLTDMAKGVVDWTVHHPEREDVGD